MRKAAIEGRARRLEALANEARQHSEEVSAEILALARNFHYEALVSALERAPTRTCDQSQTVRGVPRGLTGSDVMGQLAAPAASVLVVDDTVDNLRLLSDLLGERG